MNFFIISIVFFIIILAIYLIYKFIIKKTKIKNFIENNEYKIMKEKKRGTIYIFYANWCPHSKNTLNKLEEIKKIYLNNDKYELSFNEIDAEENTDMADSYNIDSYPTIVLKYKNKKYIYDANLNDSTFNSFIETIMV